MDKFEKELQAKLVTQVDKSYQDKFWKKFDDEFNLAGTRMSSFDKIARFYLPAFLSSVLFIILVSTFFITKYNIFNSPQVSLDFLDQYEEQIERDEKLWDDESFDSV